MTKRLSTSLQYRLRICMCAIGTFIMLWIATTAYAQEIPVYYETQQYTTIKKIDSNELLKNIQLGDSLLLHLCVDSAMHVYEATLGPSKQIQYGNGIIQSLLPLAVIYPVKGMYDKAIAEFHDAILLCYRYEKLKPMLTYLYNCLATIYQNQGKYAQASVYYYQSMRAAERDHVVSSGGIYTNLSETLIQLHEYGLALDYLDRAEQMAIRTHSYTVLGAILANKGIIYKNKKQIAKSDSFFHAALTIGKKYIHTGNGMELTYICLMHLGSINLIKGDPQKALAYLRAAQNVKGPINLVYRNEAQRILGEVYYKLHDYGKAEYYLLQSLSNAVKLQLSNNVLETHRLLSLIYQDKKENGKALEHYQSYIQIRDSIAGLETTENIRHIEIKEKTALKDKEILKNQIVINQQQHKLKENQLWIIGISAGALLLLGLFISLYRSNKHRQTVQQKQMQILQQEHALLKQEKEINQLKSVMQGEEEERKRIARELHDGIGGMLAAVKMNLSALKVNKYDDSDDEVGSIINMVQNTATEVRRTAHNLMPDVLTKHNLEKALLIYCENINTASRLQIDLQFHGSLERLNKAVELIIYRIVQELIQNIIKHSQATHAEIQITQLDDNVSITVEDNGIGFDADEHHSGQGLQNLQFRVKALQGEIFIRSVKGENTTVFIEFDLKKLHNTFIS